MSVSKKVTKVGTKLQADDLSTLTPLQAKRIRAMAKTVKGLAFGKRLKDGAVIVTGVPGWEQARLHEGTLTAGYGRNCTWAVDKDGILWGHGWTKTLPAAYLAAGASLLPAPTQADREKLATTTNAGTRMPGALAAAARRKETSKKASKPKATTAKPRSAKEAQAAA